MSYNWSLIPGIWCLSSRSVYDQEQMIHFPSSFDWVFKKQYYIFGIIRFYYSLKRNSSLHWISSLYKYNSKLTEMKIDSVMCYFFLRVYLCNVYFVFSDENCSPLNITAKINRLHIWPQLEIQSGERAFKSGKYLFVVIIIELEATHLSVWTSLCAFTAKPSSLE